MTIEIEAQIRYWTPGGMQPRPAMSGSRVRYVEAGEVERLLEEAHHRGAEQTKAQAWDTPLECGE